MDSLTETTTGGTPPSPVRRARVLERLPPGGLFADQHWLVAARPFALGTELAKEVQSLGRVLLQFYRAANLLYRQSVAGKQPEWIAGWLDQGKPGEIVELQRHAAFKSEVPRVIRPDLLLTEQGVSVTELDSVPGGIGLTAWLNEVYTEQGCEVLGGARGMLEGFAGIFGSAPRVHLVVSEESAMYRPEMDWLAKQCGAGSEATGAGRFAVRDGGFTDFQDGDAVYRFFEMFDLANVPAAKRIFELAMEKRIRVTAPPKPMLEEKMLLALLWNRRLRGFWRQELGEGFFERMLKLTPYTWVMDPASLPPHAAIPELNLTDWHQLKGLSQRERELIIKVSGYSERAWGARGVYVGSDMSGADWSAAVDAALGAFPLSPHVLQRFHKTRVVEADHLEQDAGVSARMKGRVRLCPYYFVRGDGDAARAELGGVLATICPADKKIIHGMKDAILAPCTV